LLRKGKTITVGGKLENFDFPLRTFSLREKVAEGRMRGQ
jgi:hypothetical protein